MDLLSNAGSSSRGQSRCNSRNTGRSSPSSPSGPCSRQSHSCVNIDQDINNQNSQVWNFFLSVWSILIVRFTEWWSGGLWFVRWHVGLLCTFFHLAAHPGWVHFKATTCNWVLSPWLPEYARCWQDSTPTLQVTVCMYSLYLRSSSILGKGAAVSPWKTYQVKVLWL